MPNFLFEGLLGPLFIAALLLAALLKILHFTEKMSGEFGSMASEYAGKVVGVGATAASGGASLAIGGSASALLKGRAGNYLREKAKEGGLGGRLAGGTVIMADKAQKGSWDVRNIGGKDSMFGATVGGYIGQGVGSLGIGKGGNKGGYQKVAATREAATTKKDNERAELFEVTKGEEAKMTEKERTAHEDASRIADDLEILVNNAKREAKEAEEEASASDEGQALKGSTANVSAQKAVIEKLKQSTTVDPAMIAQAERELAGAERVQAKEQEAYEKSEKGAKHKKAKEKVEEAEKKLENAEEKVKQTKNALILADATAKKDIKKENEKRREAYARRTGEKAASWSNVGKVVGGAMVGSAMGGPVGIVAGGVAGYLSGTKQANEERIRKIRKGRSSEERDKGKKLKAILKALEEAKVEEGGAGEEKEGKGKEKKEEKH